jgi:hypothetical protein
MSNGKQRRSKSERVDCPRVRSSRRHYLCRTRAITCCDCGYASHHGDHIFRPICLDRLFIGEHRFFTRPYSSHHHICGGALYCSGFLPPTHPPTGAIPGPRSDRSHPAHTRSDAEMSKLAKDTQEDFYKAMIELGLLTILIIALVVCLRMLRPQGPVSDKEC